MELKDALIIAVIAVLVMKFVRNSPEAYQFVNAPWFEEDPSTGN